MHVLLAEDNKLIASGIIAGLQAQGFQVTHAVSAAMTHAHLRNSPVDILILDLGLPDRDGLKLLEDLRHQGIETPVLILTARDAISDRVAGLQKGADDYLTKPFDLRELAARLHALLRRVAGRSSHLIEHGALIFDPANCTAQINQQPVALSRREQALLRVLLQNPKRILSAEQLRQAIYQCDDDVESNALNVHIHHLRRKLGAQIIETVRGLGYRLGPAHQSTPTST